jgi:hypothetical protein
MLAFASRRCSTQYLLSDYYHKKYYAIKHNLALGKHYSNQGKLVQLVILDLSAAFEIVFIKLN